MLKTYQLDTSKEDNFIFITAQYFLSCRPLCVYKYTIFFMYSPMISLSVTTSCWIYFVDIYTSL